MPNMMKKVEETLAQLQGQEMYWSEQLRLCRAQFQEARQQLYATQGAIQMLQSLLEDQTTEDETPSDVEEPLDE